ncbi:hypothetical protein BIFDEN_01026 [Bifidobacterium dentium ATCC 27678]|nr:hypothetical protein BIFDEN_01026 [Bifidobacterium dentium ATCC 27678]
MRLKIITLENHTASVCILRSEARTQGPRIASKPLVTTSEPCSDHEPLMPSHFPGCWDNRQLWQ